MIPQLAPSDAAQGYGTKPTANVLIGLVFTLCGLSPEIERSASTTQVSNGSAKSSGGDSGNSPDVDSIRSMATQTSGSGLSGDTDALRLACLECLEVRGGRDQVLLEQENSGGCMCWRCGWIFAQQNHLEVQERMYLMFLSLKRH